MTNPRQSLIRHQPSDDIDTFRDVASSSAILGSSAEPAADTQEAVPTTSPNEGLQLIFYPAYRASMTTSVNSVIKAIEINRPGLSGTKRDLLLFLAQGHHLALGGNALFTEPLYATDHGAAVDYQPDEDRIPEPPTAGALNTINRVLTRYADLSPADLRILVRASTPWQLAMKSTVGPRSEWAWLRDWFTRADETDDPEDERPTRTQIAAWAARHTR